MSECVHLPVMVFCIQVDTGVWHFVSVYYDHELEKDNLKLFVLDQIAHKACALNILNCVPTHTLDAKGQYLKINSKIKLVQ